MIFKRSTFAMNEAEKAADVLATFARDNIFRFHYDLSDILLSDYKKSIVVCLTFE